MKERAKIAMFGPVGPNLLSWFDYFEEKQEHFQVTIFTRSSDVEEFITDYNFIDFIQIPKDLVPFIVNILFRSFDLLIIQGLAGPYLSFFLMLCLKSRVKVIQLWNRDSHREIVRRPKTIRNICLSWVLKKADQILGFWETNTEDFKSLYPGFRDKTKTFPPGAPAKTFDLEFAPQNDEVKNLLSGIGEKDILIFWPRKIRPIHNHDLILEALSIVRARASKEIWQTIKVIFLGGDAQKAHVLPILAYIDRHDLNNVVVHWGKYIYRDYIFSLFNRSNIFVNIVKTDQLSSAIIEAGSRHNHLILSDIPQYRKFQDLGIQCKLVENDSHQIAQQILNTILEIRKNISPEFLDKNRLILMDYFDNRKRFDDIFEYCLNLQ